MKSQRYLKGTGATMDLGEIRSVHSVPFAIYELIPKFRVMTNPPNELFLVITEPSFRSIIDGMPPPESGYVT